VNIIIILTELEKRPWWSC